MSLLFAVVIPDRLARAFKPVAVPIVNVVPPATSLIKISPVVAPPVISAATVPTEVSMRLPVTPIASTASNNNVPPVLNSVVVLVAVFVKILRPAIACRAPLVEDTVVPLILISEVAPTARKSTVPAPFAVTACVTVNDPACVTTVMSLLFAVVMPLKPPSNTAVPTARLSTTPSIWFRNISPVVAPPVIWAATVGTSKSIRLLVVPIASTARKAAVPPAPTMISPVLSVVMLRPASRPMSPVPD